MCLVYQRDKSFIERKQGQPKQEKEKLAMRKIYFAYGLNLEEHTMKDCYPSAEIYKFASLRGFRLAFMGEKQGFCSLESGKYEDYVEGLAYLVNDSEIETPQKPSHRTEMDILTDSGEYVRATVFYYDLAEYKTPSEEYLMRVFKKYQDYGFNTKHIERALESLTCLEA